MSDRKIKMPTVFRTSFNLLFMLIEIATYLFIIVAVPWGLGKIFQGGFAALDKLHPFLQGWLIGFFFMGGFIMSLIGLIGLTLAGRDSLKKAIKRIRIGRE